MAFEALSQILAICQKESIDFAEAVLREDSKDRLVDREASIRQMTAMWESMCDASDSYDVSRKSNSGLVGGAGGVMADYVAAGNTLCGDAMGRVIVQALQMGESNACMKRIVAAPTAGACGVLPAVLIPLFRDDPNTIRALFVAAGIGSGHRDPAPASPEPPVAVRQRSAPPPRWRQAHSSTCAAAAVNRSSPPSP